MARSCASLRPYRSAHSGLASARIPLSDHGQRLRRRTWRITATNPRQQAPSTGYDRATWPLARRQPLDREKPQVGLSNDNYNSCSGDTYFSPLFWVFIGPFLGREVRFRRGIDHARWLLIETDPEVARFCEEPVWADGQDKPVHACSNRPPSSRTVFRGSAACPTGGCQPWPWPSSAPWTHGVRWMHPALLAFERNGQDLLCDESTKTHMPCTIRAMSGRLEAVNQSCILAGPAYYQVRASGPRACTTGARI